MGYDRGDSFPSDYEPNEIPFGLKSKGKLSPRSYPIQFERKWKYSFLSVRESYFRFLSIILKHYHADSFPFVLRRNRTSFASKLFHMNGNRKAGGFI